MILFSSIRLPALSPGLPSLSSLPSVHLQAAERARGCCLAEWSGGAQRMTKLDNPMSFKRLGGHTCHSCVSSTPSKIPYGGFSPVRLQAGFRPQPSPRYALGLYAARAQAPAANVASFEASRSEPVKQPFSWTHQPRGPWLASGLCCPAGSSLTMASSEPLGLSCRLMSSSAGLCPSAKAERFPTFICVPFAPCRLPYPGGSVGRIRLLLRRPW